MDDTSPIVYRFEAHELYTPSIVITDTQAYYYID